jgi:predicted TIM-barrel fold metal-dependent hydrolase
MQRRQLLASLAVLGLGSEIAPLLAAESPKLRLTHAIDTHHHCTPPAYLAAAQTAAAKGASPVPPPMRNWTIAKSLEQMDRYGIGSAVLSLINQPDIWLSGDLAANRLLARECNEYMAALVRDHPGRFGFFACVPLPDVEGSLAEIAYAIDTLKADGIGLFTSYGKKWPGDPAFAGVFDELARRKLVVYFHPYAPSCCARLIPSVPDNFIEFPQDTARSVVSLLFNGRFAQHRAIKWLFSHAGGPIPMYGGRIATLAGSRFPNLDKVAPEGVEAELKRLYYDTANATYPATMHALMDYVPVSQIVFGTDYPYVEVEDDVSGFVDLKLSGSQRRAIERVNAERLLPRFKA